GSTCEPEALPEDVDEQLPGLQLELVAHAIHGQRYGSQGSLLLPRESDRPSVLPPRHPCQRVRVGSSRNDDVQLESGLGPARACTSGRGSTPAASPRGPPAPYGRPVLPGSPRRGSAFARGGSPFACRPR